MGRFNPIPVKINSDEVFAKFLEDNKKKIPEDVIIERVVSSLNDHVLQNNSCDEGMAIHAFALSLGLYLPLNPLISEILGKLRLAPTQLGPNCWRVMFGILALNQYFCKIKLGWKEFCYCYIVKRNSAGFYYFSPRQKNYALVTKLPNSEKGWKDVYIYLKGNWGGAATGNTTTTSFPTTENTSGEPAGANYIGLKPQDWEVNIKDLEKAWSFENKAWRYLLDPANWRNDGEQITEVTYNNGATVAGSSLLTEAREEVTCQGVINSLENIDSEVEQPAQPGGESPFDEIITNVSLPSQPPSKKQKTINHDDLGSSGGYVAHVHDHIIMNLESTPAATIPCGGGHCQEAAGDLSLILPNHSPHCQSIDNNPPVQLHHSITPRAGIELFKETMNTLRSSLFSGGEFEKAIQLLGKKSEDEAGLGLAQLLVMVGLHLASIVESQDSKDKTIKELEATNERLEKEVAELKLGTSCREAVGMGMGHGNSSTAAQIENLTKVVEGLRSDVLTQIKEMKTTSHGQLNEPTFNNQLQGQNEAPPLYNQSLQGQNEPSSSYLDLSDFEHLQFPLEEQDQYLELSLSNSKKLARNIDSGVET